MIITQFSAISRNIVVYSVVSLFNCLWMLPKKGKRSCLSTLVLSSTSTWKMTVLPPPTGYKTIKIAFRFGSIFIINRKYVSFVYIKRNQMLNLLSCLDFVFVFRVFNFVSCPSRHMRWKLFPDVSKDYSRLPITRTFKGNRKEKGSSYLEFEENSRE